MYLRGLSGLGDDSVSLTDPNALVATSADTTGASNILFNTPGALQAGGQVVASSVGAKVSSLSTAQKLMLFGGIAAIVLIVVGASEN
jgi:hypothetical protein